KISKTSPPAKKTHILEWKFLNDEKAIADEWIIDNHSITKSFLDFMNMAISLANEEQSYYKLKVKLDDPGKKLLRKCQNVWKHLCENWKTSFDDNRTVEDICVHELLHPLLKPFFTIEQGHDINCAERKCNEEGDGHKLDFMISVDINGDADKFETLYGLFKSPIKLIPI
ncbi:6480_t:CDS:2, partial [Entrophospora sp. SA101]